MRDKNFNVTGSARGTRNVLDRWKVNSITSYYVLTNPILPPSHKNTSYTSLDFPLDEQEDQGRGQLAPRIILCFWPDPSDAMPKYGHLLLFMLETQKFVATAILLC